MAANKFTQKFKDLFAFDLDGTLVHKDEKGMRVIPSDLLEIVHRISKRAHIVIATGRRFRAASAELKLLPAMPYSIFHNGLVLKDHLGNTIDIEELSTETAFKIAQILEGFKLDCFFVCDSDEIDFVYSKKALEQSPEIQMVHRRSEVRNHLLDSLEDIQNFKKAQVIEVAALGPYTKLIQLQAQLKDLLPAPFRAIVVKNIGVEGLGALEIFSKSRSKWTGVISVKEKLGAERVIAVGDDENDLEMLKSADIGVVMDHAEAHIREVSSIHARGPLGLADFLKGFYPL